MKDEYDFAGAEQGKSYRPIEEPVLMLKKEQKKNCWNDQEVQNQKNTRHSWGHRGDLRAVRTDRRRMCERGTP